MSIDFIPTVPIALALAACVLAPIVLFALSHGPLKLSAPGRRFAIAASLTWLAWIASMLALEPGWVDLLAGALLLATATVIGFTLWTLIVWGFTLSMLLALARAARPLSLEEWALECARGKPLEAFARDRLGVLFALHLAETRGEEVVITQRRGRAFAKAAVVLRTLFGLPR
jgi:hypothetical protein